jgi:hypothetical protein
LAGWVGAAIVVAAVALAAHPMLPVVAVDVSAIVLTAADVAASAARVHRYRLREEQASRAIFTGPGWPAWAAAEAPAAGRAARRPRGASFCASVTQLAAWRLVRRDGRVFASLPRPVAWFLTAAIWLTAGAYLWLIFEFAASPPQFWGWSDVGTTASGQQLVALVWMTHLICWSLVACRRLGRIRAAASIMPEISAGSR